MVSLDEQRHIGFGVKTLADCFAQSEECKSAVAELMAEVLRYVAGVFVPPNWDRSYTRCYGFELEDIYAFGIGSIRSKWRAAGFPVEEMPRGVFPVDFSLGDEEIARRVILLTAAGVLGEPNRRLDITPEVQALFFDTVAASVEPGRSGARPLCIQWHFTDALPWHVLIDSATARPVAGRRAERGRDDRDVLEGLDRPRRPRDHADRGGARPALQGPRFAAGAASPAAAGPLPAEDRLSVARRVSGGGRGGRRAGRGCRWSTRA